jgi:hypothetical protein
MLKIFGGSLVMTLVGLAVGFATGYYYEGTIEAGLQALLITSVLAILEISLSFDNAVVNAKVLANMDPLWQKRFLTWGMLIAVFGMRLILPISIVALMAHISPVDAFILAATKPHEYARLMTDSHLMLAGFGGAFLLNVALKYFFDPEKNLHWLSWLERPLTKMGQMESFDLAITMTVVILISRHLATLAEQNTFIVSALAGLLTFIGVDGLGNFLKAPTRTKIVGRNASVGMFLYLEVMDASFSFDGVIGSFALTHNLFIIMIGLSIGALFVRSLTVLMVKRQTLAEFVYLEHGAFYAIGIIAVLMMVNVILPISEIATGLIGGAFIVLALISSLKLPEKRA